MRTGELLGRRALLHAPVVKNIAAQMIGGRVYVDAEDVAEALRVSGYAELADSFRLKAALFGQAHAKPLPGALLASVAAGGSPQ